VSTSHTRTIIFLFFTNNLIRYQQISLMLPASTNSEDLPKIHNLWDQKKGTREGFANYKSLLLPIQWTLLNSYTGTDTFLLYCITSSELCFHTDCLTAANVIVNGNNVSWHKISYSSSGFPWVPTLLFAIVVVAVEGPVVKAVVAVVRTVDELIPGPWVELVHECLPLLLSSTDDRIDGAQDSWVIFSSFSWT